MIMPRVVLYTHEDPRTLVPQLSAARIHRADQLGVYSLDRDFVDALATKLERRNRFGRSVSVAQLYVTIGDETFSVAIGRHPLPCTS